MVPVAIFSPKVQKFTCLHWLVQSSRRGRNPQGEEGKTESDTGPMTGGTGKSQGKKAGKKSVRNQGGTTHSVTLCLRDRPPRTKGLETTLSGIISPGTCIFKLFKTEPFSSRFPLRQKRPFRKLPTAWTLCPAGLGARRGPEPTFFEGSRLSPRYVARCCLKATEPDKSALVPRSSTFPPRGRRRRKGSAAAATAPGGHPVLPPFRSGGARTLLLLLILSPANRSRRQRSSSSIWQT